MNGRELLEGMSFIHGKYVQEADGPLVIEVRKRTGFWKKPLFIAAVIGLTILLMGSAIFARVTMNVGKVKSIISVAKPTEDTWLDAYVLETQTYAYEYREGERVEFEKTDDQFIELGSYYPTEIPDGYTMTFVSDTDSMQKQRIVYENAEGKYIDFWVFIGDPAANVEIYDIIERSNIKINGHDGILYEQGSGLTLVWIYEDVGHGFALRAQDSNVDLVAMAESTVEGEPLVPTRTESIMKGLEELGDLSPTYLPAGFEELNVSASPLDDGGGWYSYVRKWYVNKAENTRIYFEYETYVIATEDGYTDDAKTICSFFIPGYERGVAVYEEVEIDGMFGLATENDIAWADPDKHIVYHLYSEDITGDELMKVAQSIKAESNN